MSIDRGQVAVWLKEASDRLSKTNEEMTELTETRSRLERQVALLRELMGEEDAAVAAPTQPALGSEFRYALNAILAEAGRPLHLSEIRAALAERRVEVPGRGTDANIIAHLSRVPGVHRVERGTYLLGATGVAPTKPRRRKRRRKAKTKPAIDNR